MEARHRAVELGGAYVGVTEEGGNNRGRIVEMFQRADTLPGEGYAWCQAFQNGLWRLATGAKIVTRAGRPEIVGGQMLADGTASVGHFVAWARRKGYVVTRPFKGDHGCMHLDSDTWADHVFIVEKVLQIGPVLIVRTIEGNTSSGDGGSQGEGDGIYRRTRVLRASKVVFVRAPGAAVLPPKPPPKYVTRYAVALGVAGRRRAVGQYPASTLGRAVERAALQLRDGESIRIDRKRVRV